MDTSYGTVATLLLLRRSLRRSGLRCAGRGREHQRERARGEEREFEQCSFGEAVRVEAAAEFVDAEPRPAGDDAADEREHRDAAFL